MKGRSEREDREREEEEKRRKKEEEERSEEEGRDNRRFPSQSSTSPSLLYTTHGHTVLF